MSDVVMSLENVGDISIVDNDVMLDDGYVTAMLHALWGGDKSSAWWGNLIPGVDYGSETQTLTRTMSLTSGNLERLQKAIEADLGKAGFDRINEIKISIPSPNTVKITIGDIEIVRPWQ